MRSSNDEFYDKNYRIKTPKVNKSSSHHQSPSIDSSPLQLDLRLSDISEVIEERKSGLSEAKKTIQTRFTDGVKSKVKNSSFLFLVVLFLFLSNNYFFTKDHSITEALLRAEIANGETKSNRAIPLTSSSRQNNSTGNRPLPIGDLPNYDSPQR